MSNIVKALTLLVIVAIALTIVERWFNIFYLGNLYTNIGAGLALIGWATPVMTVVVALYLAWKVVKAK